MDIIETIETIVMHKAKRMTKKDDKYMKHIKGLLRDCGISTNKDMVQAFKMGAVDAMIYDVGSILGSRKIRSHAKRKEILGKLFPKQ